MKKHDIDQNNKTFAQDAAQFINDAFIISAQNITFHSLNPMSLDELEAILPHSLAEILNADRLESTMSLATRARNNDKLTAIDCRAIDMLIWKKMDQIVKSSWDEFLAKVEHTRELQYQCDTHGLSDCDLHIQQLLTRIKAHPPPPNVYPDFYFCDDQNQRLEKTKMIWSKAFKYGDFDYV